MAGSGTSRPSRVGHLARRGAGARFHAAGPRRRPVRIAGHADRHSTMRSGAAMPPVSRCSSSAAVWGWPGGRVRTFADAESFPERAVRAPGPSILAPDLAHLEARLAAGWENAIALWRDRDMPPAPASPTAGDSAPALPSPKQLAWRLTRLQDKLTEEGAAIAASSKMRKPPPSTRWSAGSPTSCVATAPTAMRRAGHRSGRSRAGARMPRRAVSLPSPPSPPACSKTALP